MAAGYLLAMTDVLLADAPGIARAAALLRGGSLVALQISAGGQGVSTDWWAWGNLPGQNPDGTLESNWTTPRSEQEAVYSQLRPRPLPDQ